MHQFVKTVGLVYLIQMRKADCFGETGICTYLAHHQLERDLVVVIVVVVVVVIIINNNGGSLLTVEQTGYRAEGNNNNNNNNNSSNVHLQSVLCSILSMHIAAALPGGAIVPRPCCHTAP